MTQPFSAAIERIKRLPSGRWLFFRRALAHPLQLGTPIPSSPALGRLVAALLEDRKNGLTVEIGGGTGVITRQLLAAGVPAERLLVLEIDPEMADYLRGTLPEARVVTGDARNLPQLLPPSWRGRVDTIVSGVPMAVLTAAYQRERCLTSWRPMAATCNTPSRSAVRPSAPGASVSSAAAWARPSATSRRRRCGPTGRSTPAPNTPSPDRPGWPAGARRARP
jgi:phospholipid N-methyltransferase